MDQSRVEAGLVLIDIDFVSAAHALLEVRKSAPHEMGLAWTVKLAPDRDFVGRAALERAVERGFRTQLVGVEVPWMELERVHARFGLRPQNAHHPPSREPAALYRAGGESRQVGQVTSQCFSPLLKKQIGLASVARCSSTMTSGKPSGSGFVDCSPELTFRVEASRGCFSSTTCDEVPRRRGEGRAWPPLATDAGRARVLTNAYRGEQMARCPPRARESPSSGKVA